MVDDSGEFEQTFNELIGACRLLDVKKPDELVAEVDALRVSVDELLRAAVGVQRRHGMSWTQIGRQLGTTKQNAQQRFGTPR